MRGPDINAVSGNRPAVSFNHTRNNDMYFAIKCESNIKARYHTKKGNNDLSKYEHVLILDIQLTQEGNFVNVHLSKFIISMGQHVY